MRLLLIFIWTLSLIGCGSARTPLPVADPQPVEVPQPIEVAGNPQTDNRQTSGQPLQAVRLVLPTPDDSNRPHEVHEQGYVSSEACRSCHPQEYSSWHASYHRTMTQLATPETVRGDFANAVTNFGSQQRFFQEGDQFKAEMLVVVPENSSDQSTHPTSLRRALVEMSVTLVTGSHHQQVYWYPTGHGRLLGMVPFSYVLEEQRWVPRNAVFLRPGGPDRPEDWQVWNESCIRCHTTLGRPRYGENTVDTEVVEFGISCEACHGPAHEHVAEDRTSRTSRTSKEPTIIDLRKLSPRAASQVCAQCHSLWDFDNLEAHDYWNAHGVRYRPGDELEDTRQIVIPSEKSAEGEEPDTESEPAFVAHTFWPDGMVRVSGREYNGLANSPCFQRGKLSCLSCHTMHQPADDPRPVSEWANDQLALGMNSNQACTQCHDEFAASDRLAEHSHHAPDSTGSQCYNCHMPHTTYGLLKAIRSHQIDSPDVATNVRTGRPNACNLCHLDQSLQWTSTHLNRWYGIEPHALSDDQEKVAAGPLWLLSGDAGQRALIAWSMNWPPAQQVSGTDWMAPLLAQLLIDPYPPVRLLAHRALRKRPGYETLDYDFVGTNDSQESASRAAREIWENQDRVSTDWSDSLRQALVEFSRLLGMRDDRPVHLLE